MNFSAFAFLPSAGNAERNSGNAEGPGSFAEMRRAKPRRVARRPSGILPAQLHVISTLDEIAHAVLVVALRTDRQELRARHTLLAVDAECVVGVRCR